MCKLNQQCRISCVHDERSKSVLCRRLLSIYAFTETYPRVQIRKGRRLDLFPLHQWHVNYTRALKIRVNRSRELLGNTICTNLYSTHNPYTPSEYWPGGQNQRHGVPTLRSAQLPVSCHFRADSSRQRSQFSSSVCGLNSLRKSD